MSFANVAPKLCTLEGGSTAYPRSGAASRRCLRNSQAGRPRGLNQRIRGLPTRFGRFPADV